MRLFFQRWVIMFIIPTVALAHLGGGERILGATISSFNGQKWDVRDITGSDTGAIDDGGQDAFDTWGGISLRVLDTSNNILGTLNEMSGFQLTHDGSRSWNTLSPVTFNGVSVTRSLFARANTDWMRYHDKFTNTTAGVLRLQASWGGNLGSDSNTTVARTSSGDLNFTAADVWGVTIENDSSDPAGPATDPPVGYVLGNRSLIGVNRNPFDTPFSKGQTYIFFSYEFDLNPGETGGLVNFVYRGLEENTTGPLGQNPTTGTEIALAIATVNALSLNRDFTGMSESDIAGLKNVVPEPTTLVVWSLGVGSVVIRRKIRGRRSA